MGSSSSASLSNFHPCWLSVLNPIKDYVAFEKPFFVYWEKEIGLQCCTFIDPEGNAFEIQLNEPLLAERKFPAGGNLFHFRVFDWDWTEINYPIPNQQTRFPKPLRSVKFFTCFCVDFPLEQGSIIFDDAFSHFWGPIFDSSNPDMYQKVEMVDPVGKNYEVFIEGSYTGRIFARHGLEKMVTNYDLREDHVMRLNFIGDRKFLFRIFSLTGNEVIYSLDLIKDEPTINEEDGLERDFYYKTTKNLTDYDVNSSSLYLDSEFASKALVKNRKNHELRNRNGGSWSCTVRWAKKRTHECFLSCGWKKFCAANGFQAGDVITFGVDINRSNIINVRKD
ncbi:hypothetical protein DEO72_LG9g2133 [Vigna unguiculata]|uniref:TF-B3 domain-containing protein n=1 Tax=Vigna unguiculata TaxID=3917 RepID=A0A4D6N551_VIGUN|nr:hypothetical protein DEO72_LG9g2133 [Vigna unguiculata]